MTIMIEERHKDEVREIRKDQIDHSGPYKPWQKALDVFLNAM